MRGQAWKVRVPPRVDEREALQGRGVTDPGGWHGNWCQQQIDDIQLLYAPGNAPFSTNKCPVEFCKYTKTRWVQVRQQSGGFFYKKNIKRIKTGMQQPRSISHWASFHVVCKFRWKKFLDFSSIDAVLIITLKNGSNFRQISEKNMKKKFLVLITARPCCVQGTTNCVKLAELYK